MLWLTEKELVTLFHPIVPGVSISIIIALLATLCGRYIPLAGSNVLALGIGLVLNFILTHSKSHLQPGLLFSSKTLLRLAIIFLGASLSMGEIVEVGRYSILVMLFTLTAAFGFGYFFGYLLKTGWKMSTLISAGTGVCGGSAIVALSPVIEADESEVTYAIAATFIFDVAMIILFPIMGRALGLSDLAYGLWTGTAVNDTSSVVAAGYGFSEAAGAFATIVKLTRTLSIIPLVLIYSAIGTIKRDTAQGKGKALNRWQHLRKVTPWFILWFVGLAALNSVGLIPVGIKGILKWTSRFFMTIALGAIGLNTDLKKLKATGWNPMLLGFVLSAIVVIVSLAVQFGLGQL